MFEIENHQKLSQNFWKLKVKHETENENWKGKLILSMIPNEPYYFLFFAWYQCSYIAYMRSRHLSWFSCVHANICVKFLLYKINECMIHFQVNSSIFINFMRPHGRPSQLLSESPLFKNTETVSLWRNFVYRVGYMLR